MGRVIKRGVIVVPQAEAEIQAWSKLPVVLRVPGIRIDVPVPARVAGRDLGGARDNIPREEVRERPFLSAEGGVTGPWPGCAIPREDPASFA